MTTYLLNILPHKLLNYKSRLRVLYHKDPTYSHIRVFGCLYYPLFSSTTINKLQPRSSPCVFLGYPSNHRGYKCYDLSYGKIIISRHVIFYETQFPFVKLHTPRIQTYDFLDDDPNPYVIHHLVSQFTTPNAQTSGLVPFGPNSPNIATGPTIEPKKNIVNYMNYLVTASAPLNLAPS